MDENTSLLEIKGIGEKTLKLFQKLNISTAGQLLRYFPKDYETFRSAMPIAKCSVGQVCAIEARVVAIPYAKKVRNLDILQIDVRDCSGAMRLTFFNMPFLKKVLAVGNTFIFRGLVQSRGPAIVMEQPKYYKPEEYSRFVDKLLPKYALTKGLTNQTITKAMNQVVREMNPVPEFYSENILSRYGLIPSDEAMVRMHFPENLEAVIEARRRLVFDEFFQFLFFLRKNKELCSTLPNAYPMFETADTVRFLEQLPFDLTKGQKQVWRDIKEDVNSPGCMNRLIQGDVGSGKTIVAVLALLMCVANGYQGAFMAPTEVLAVQHFETINSFINAYHIAFRPVLLVGSMTAKEKRLAYEKIASGEANLIIGTHALIQEKVIYKSLALVVTDEQHRFGVHQRETLASKGNNPHVLVMSATPIPRTLAIILYGDLNLSVIKELPADRLPIKNCVVGTSYRPKAYEFIAKEVENGRQAYVICPQVSAGEMDELENVVDYASRLSATLPAGVRVSYLHGKMRPGDKNRVMDDFANGNIDVLVSTTVIEVGINCPNATVMMVENAERFGLAQLHQLRGRVGRGSYQSYCIFVNTSESPESKERLDILNHSNDGFYIASEDLKLRGPGDLFGVRQSGEFAFRLGDIYNDAEILKQADEAVDLLLKEDRQLESPKNKTLKEYFEKHKGEVDFRTI